MYLDTSVLAALYLPEPGSSAAAAAVGSRPPAISALIEVEFASVVARRVRERSISAQDAANVLALFDTHLTERRYRHLPVGAEAFAEARRMLRSGKVPLSALDAMHLAIVALHRQTLCTADRQLARIAERLNLKTVLVRT